jgi:hypothetical protein
MEVLRVGHEPHADILALTRRYGLVLRHVDAGEDLPGSYWGES